MADARAPSRMLSDGLDAAAYADRFKSERRVILRDVLEPRYAEAVQAALARLPWSLTYTDGRSNIRTPHAELAALSAAERQALVRDVHALARRGVGFMYNSYFLSDAYRAGDYEDSIAFDVLRLINSEPFLALVRSVTGDKRIDRADAQATMYGPGSFLTRHNDVEEAGERRIAYVFGFTRPWHPDWGGLLQFFHDDGVPDIAIAPQFNVMTLFDVRQVHSVTMVTPFAGAPRLSITGWFRGG